jgi:hypothetical protein
MDWKVEAAAGPYTLKSMDEREYSDGDTTLTYTTELYFKDERIYKKSSATHNGMGGAFGSHHSVKLEEKAGRFALRVIENRVEKSGAATNGEAHLDPARRRRLRFGCWMPARWSWRKRSTTETWVNQAL